MNKIKTFIYFKEAIANLSWRKTTEREFYFNSACYPLILHMVASKLERF